MCLSASGIDGVSPTQKSQKTSLPLVSINHYQWKKYCRGLFELLSSKFFAFAGLKIGGHYT
jgi:hypothetical protein